MDKTSKSHDVTLQVSEKGAPPQKLERRAPGEWNRGDTILDTCEVKEVFESGGFGKVYRVHHHGWNVDLAVKSLRTQFADDETWKAHFMRECEGWVNLGLHPHVVTCYYVRDIGGLPHIFAEFMEGGSLDEWLQEGRLTGFPQIIDSALQCLGGLDFAHRKGLVHRDIKPDNCLFTGDGKLKIADFGIASGLSQLRGDTSRSDGSALPGKTMVVQGAIGTPAYMPPEQWDTMYGEMGPWTDLYAFGVMLFEMCAGERPSDEGHEAERPAHGERIRGKGRQSLPHAGSTVGCGSALRKTLSSPFSPCRILPATDTITHGWIGVHPLLSR